MPGREGLGRVGDMAQATTLFDSAGPAGLHDLQGTAHRGAARQVSPITCEGDSRHRGPALLRSPRRRPRPHRRRRRSRTCAKAGGRRAAARSRSSSRGRASSRATRRSAASCRKSSSPRELESTYSKDEILELYLNKVYFGDGLLRRRGRRRSATSASTRRDLTLRRSGAARRPREVAVRLRADGQPRARGRAAHRRAAGDGATPARSRADACRRARQRTPWCSKDGLRATSRTASTSRKKCAASWSSSSAWQRVYQGGLSVYTTIDLDMQTGRRDGRRRSCDRSTIETRGAAASATEASGAADDDTARCRRRCVAMDPAHRRGARAGRRPQLRREPLRSRRRRRIGSRARRSSRSSTPPRSSRAGRRPRSSIDLDEPIATLQGAWMPEDEHSTRRELTLRTALRTSSNRAAVRLLQEVGIPKTVAIAKRLGVGDGAERAVAGAGIGRSHAAGADRAPTPPSPARASITRRC